VKLEINELEDNFYLVSLWPSYIKFPEPKPENLDSRHLFNNIFFCGSPISSYTQEDLDKEEWRQLPIWKAKKWAAHILHHVFER
jgi:hypothetical protein